MRRFAKLLPVFAMFGLVTTLSAAPETTPETTPPAAPPTDHVMTVGEMNVAAAGIEARLEEDSQQVARLQEITKKQKDVIKLNCVNDRLVQLKAQRNIADETHAQLTAALAKNSDERITLFNQLRTVADNANGLAEQAKGCIGEPELYKTESGVTVDKPLIPDDPTVVPPAIDNGVEPPGYASPWD